MNGNASGLTSARRSGRELISERRRFMHSRHCVLWVVFIVSTGVSAGCGSADNAPGPQNSGGGMIPSGASGHSGAGASSASSGSGSSAGSGSSGSASSGSASGAWVPDPLVSDASAADAASPGVSRADASDGASTTVVSTFDGDAGCSVLPVNPKATQQARNLLCYLYSQAGNHVLSGQQETSWASNPDVDNNIIFSSTGKYPAVRGGDFLYPNGTTARAQAWWNAGGIPMLCHHMGAPPMPDTYPNSMVATTGGINAVLTPGTPEYVSFLQKLDYGAGELAKLQAANVAVLWRPFHEAGGTWFWWSKEGGAQYIRLWRFMFDYFTVTKGLNNIIWMHPYDGTPASGFFPGKAYVDVAGADTYSTSPPFAPLFASTRSIVGATLPIALHETGTVPDPATMFAGSAAPWLLFNIWAGFESSANSPSSLRTAYSSPYTVTRDKVPSLK